jgi:hypothetical protein
MEHAGAPQNPGTAAHATVVQVLLRSAGTRWNAPEWLVSGDASNMGAYTSSLVAESPFVKAVTRAQAYYKARFELIVRKAITCAIAHGWLPGDVMTGVTVELIPPSPEVRNKLEETQRASIEIPLGVDSRQRYCESQDRDYEQIEAENRQYAQENGQPGQQLPDNLPQDGGGADARTDDTELPESLLEMLEEMDGVEVRDLLEADAPKAPPGKVWKEITFQRGGKSVTQKRLVNAPLAKKGKPAAKGKPEPAAKPVKADPKATAEAVKAQLAGDASKLTPKTVASLNEKLATLTVPQLKALKAEHDLKGGRSKAEHIASLVAKAKELKKKADAEKRAAKKTAGKTEPKPAEPTPAEPTPAPKAEAAPEGPHSVQHRLIGSLNAADGLSDEQREHYGRSLARVVRTMPKEALDRIDANLDNVSFHASTKDIPEAMIEQIAGQPGLDDSQRDAIRKQYAHLRDAKIGGVYMNGFKHVHVDGDGPGANTKGRHGKDFGLAHGIYGHEFTHAIDGPSHEISKSPEWQSAFAKEIAHDPAAEPPLTRYAGTKPSEGLAEFGRLVYASDVPHAQIAKEFPQATAIFKAHGLWPKAERGGAEAKMPEVFEKRIDLGKDGSHADVLKTQGGAPEPKPAAASKPPAGLDAKHRALHAKLADAVSRAKADPHSVSDEETDAHPRCDRWRPAGRQDGVERRHGCGSVGRVRDSVSLAGTR